MCLLTEKLIGKQPKTDWYLPLRPTAFLRNMVRRITAALLMVGLGRMSEQELLESVHAKHRWR
ncbi:MAG: hypothetical protein IPM95_14365 [Sphingobacteriales bacterium]|nr:hypothetical protein [Sphingobacteriales bacterium]